MRILLGLVLACCLTTNLAAEDFRSLFNGKDLTGWKGLTDHWSVQDGMIVGTSVGKPIKGNTFLVWQDGQMGDFELVAEMRAEGNNSGIQYRSQVLDDAKFVMKGYQCDLHPSPEYLGMLYAEKWRGILATRGQAGTLPAEGKIKISREMPTKPEFKLEDFNTVRILAVGNRLIHQINGVTTIDVIDEHPEAMKTGQLGLQLHQGPAMTVQVKSIKLRALAQDEGQKLIEDVAASAEKAAQKKKDAEAKLAQNMEALPGFEVECVYVVPLEEQGSWVALDRDGRGGLIASDEKSKGMYRITFDGQGAVHVEKLGLDASGAQGLLVHEGDLYFNKHPQGMHRASDSNGDGSWDTIEDLPSATGSGEHGTHAIIRDETGTEFFTVAGNFCTPPKIDRYHVKAWQEDEIIPRLWDPRGHARGIMTPGGFITTFDPESKTSDMYSMGYRNAYDLALNRFGDLFAFDSDMEWDMGMPWYRPTRITHSTSGSDFGWRSGSLNSPSYYEDTLPPILDIGPGSPTGMLAGTGLKFPTKYQDAIYALDWTFGTIYAVHLEPAGSSYTATHEPLLNGSPLPVTDAAVGEDGHLYFATGGRGAQSALYRVKYAGSESTAAPTSPMTAEAKKRHELRRSLEVFHGVLAPEAVDLAWPHLASEDRFLRYAARLAIESQPAEQWAKRVVQETSPQARITGAIALARVGGKEHQASVYEALIGLDVKTLDVMQKLGLLRAYEIAFARLGLPGGTLRESIVAQLQPEILKLDGSVDVQADALKVLVAINAPQVAEKGVKLLMERPRPQQEAWAVRLENNDRYGSTVKQMLENPPDLFGLRLAYSLKNVKSGWTLPLRREFLTFLNTQGKAVGGASYPGFLKLIRDDFLGNATNEERAALADLSGESFQPEPDFEITPPKGPGREWTVASALSSLGKTKMKDASFENGRNLYFATTCGKCHRFAGMGGDIGPDLTTISNKFDQKYLVESLLDPSKNISDQYQSTTVILSNGMQYTGLVIERDGKVVIYPSDVNAKEVAVSADEIELKEPSPISQMPANLINGLNDEELRDLVAYLMSAGDAGASVYGKKK